MGRAAEGRHVWRSADYAGRTDWVMQLAPDEVSELEQAAEAARRSGVRLEDASQEHFPLPQLAGRLARVRHELAHGSGFVLMRGLRVDCYSQDEIGALFWGLGTHIGVGVTQSLGGDRLGQVMDIGGDKSRYYTRGGELEFHMDPVDVVGLLCLRSALSGGESRIVSSMAIYNAIRTERPDLMPALAAGYHYSRRTQDPHGAQRFTSHRVPVFMEGAWGTECYFLPASIRGALEDGAPIDDAGREAMACVASVASRPELHLDMSFREGDIQLLNNRRVLHARTDYVEHPDPARKRLLLRLWLMMPDWPPRPASMRPSAAETDRAGGGYAVPGRT